MERKDKRRIRGEIGRMLDIECKGCRFKRRPEHADYCSNTCPVGIYMQELMSQLCLDDAPVIKEEREETRPLNSGTWSEDEVFYLVNHVPYFPVKHLAKRLNRAHQTVYLKIRYLGVKKHAV